MHRPHFNPGKGPVPILQEAGWAPGTVWTGGKSGIQYRTVQPVVSRNTDWATQPTASYILLFIMKKYAWKYQFPKYF